MQKIFVLAITLVCYACQEQQPKLAVSQPTTDSLASQPDSTALNWIQLAAYLPDIKGYQALDSTGENTYTGASGSRYHAFARRQYKRNDKELTVEIIDYNNDPKTFRGLLNMYGFNTPIQNEQLKTRAVESGIPHVKALETVYANTKDIRLTLAVAERFMIHITEPGGYDVHLPEQVMKAIPFYLFNKRE